VGSRYLEGAAPAGGARARDHKRLLMRADVDARLPRTRDCAAIARRLIEKHVGADAGCQPSTT
jgi:hypothetical protein